MAEGAQRSWPEVAVRLERHPSGAVVLTNAAPAPPCSETLIDRLRRWAGSRPDAVFLTEPKAAGRRRVTYAQALALVEAWGARLLALNPQPAVPVMVLAANGIDAALAILGAMDVGLAPAVVSPNYGMATAAPYARLASIVGVLRPALVLSDQPGQTVAALTALGAQGRQVVDIHDAAWFERAATASAGDLAAARAAPTLDSLAKILFTSGSTGAPKAVINTHRMMASNMQALAKAWPFLEERPPELVDWLPWSHTFGGNCCFNIALYYGGALNIDVGKPTPGAIDHTLEALRSLSPSIYFNVPAGYEALLPHLEADPALARRFLGGLDFLFSAGAALPASSRRRLDDLALDVLGRTVPIFGGWGSTETAPFSTVIYFDTEPGPNLGVPLPGVEVKLAPAGDKQELRVRGPNVTPGYWGDPAASAAAFDEDGFYRIGDCGRFVDEDRPELGLAFDGRISENFKLLSGTWVNVGALRLAVIDAARPYVADAVVTGEGRDEVGALIFPNLKAAQAAIGPERASARPDALMRQVADRIDDLLSAYNAAQPKPSARIARFVVLSEPPSLDKGEITEKGYLNQRGVLQGRAGDVARLYAEGRRVRHVH